MKKCGLKTERWSRVVGFYRPVDHCNPGKREEIRLRKTYKTFNNVPVKDIKSIDKINNK